MKNSKKIISICLFMFYFFGSCVGNPNHILELKKELKVDKLKEGVGYLHVDKNRMVYVPILDSGEIRIYTEEGVLLKVIERKGESENKLMCTVGVVVDESGNIYAGDGFSGINKFSFNGNFIKKWGKRIELEDYKQRVKEKKDLSEDEFFILDKIDIDCAGNIYIIDVQRILKFDSEGNTLSIFRMPQLKSSIVLGLVKIDCSGNILYLNPFQDSKILIFSPELEIVDVVEYPEEIDKYKLSVPENLLLDSEGNIYLLFQADTESYFLTRIFKNNRKLESFVFPRLVNRLPRFDRASIDKQGKYLFIPVVLPAEKDSREDWFLQIYEIPK